MLDGIKPHVNAGQPAEAKKEASEDQAESADTADDSGIRKMLDSEDQEEAGTTASNYADFFLAYATIPGSDNMQRIFNSLFAKLMKQ